MRNLLRLNIFSCVGRFPRNRVKAFDDSFVSIDKTLQAKGSPHRRHLAKSRMHTKTERPCGSRQVL